MAKMTCTSDRLSAPSSLKNHPFYGLTLDEQQKEFRDSIWSMDKLIVFCNAKAGTGKTLIATATANLLCKYGRYQGITYIAAPTQEQKQGYLKGTIEEKSEPYFEPFYEALKKIGVNLNTSFYDNPINEKFQTAYIECLTHTFLRGTNFENRVVIIDECQNFYFDELMKVLTRIHDNCKVIIIGHDGQNDLLSNPDRSGFVPYLNWFKDDDRTAVCKLEKNYRGWISQHADRFNFKLALR
ncbi:phosphate starvation-inducible protein PhoH [bacterium D16-76]|nr:phosphate starvation-inducible protein PhoH [bacterium D16-76]